MALAIDERIEIEGGRSTAPFSFDKRRTQRLDPCFGHGRILSLQNDYQIWYIRPMAVGGRAGPCDLANRMKKGNTTKLRLNPKKPPKTDWRAFDGMSEAQRHAAAISDPDCPPATKAQLARARRAPNVRAVRQSMKLTQEEFAARFGLPLGTVRDWEQGAHRPDRAAQVLLRVIAKNPEAVIRALKEKPAA